VPKGQRKARRRGMLCWQREKEEHGVVSGLDKGKTGEKLMSNELSLWGKNTVLSWGRKKRGEGGTNCHFVSSCGKTAVEEGVPSKIGSSGCG